MSEYIYRSNGEPLANERGEILLARVGEVVRCRDCIRYSLDDYDNTWCAYVASAVQPDDFCAWGEREDGDAR